LPSSSGVPRPPWPAAAGDFASTRRCYPQLLQLIFLILHKNGCHQNDNSDQQNFVYFSTPLFAIVPLYTSADLVRHWRLVAWDIYSH